ncbi:MAG: UDP-N-acetylmuramyl-tripeptide synthetase, partial [Lentisphaeria bacterium]|nr:UDP-N-acetylmuramyl-tripeptide synthetase [Lentisphaeria bacterium]
FTNLTGDHLDYHGDMEHYYQAKKLLFTHMLREGAPAIVSVDNPGGERLFEELKKEKFNVCGVTLCGNPCADAFVKEIHMTPEGSAFTLTFEGKQLSIHTPLCGRFNICNVAEGLLLAWKTGIPETVLQKAAAEFQAPPGRLEKIFLPHRKAYAFVDYAHTDDALDQVLQTLSELSAGKKIITVFGCGGDRDRTKRPRMARAASVYSSEVILTRDNPRNENPSGIFEDIIQGFPDAYPFRIVEDRKEAIETALESAGEGDIVLIAGKGHEKYQEICGVRNHFDDRETVLQYLQKTMKNKTGEL